MSIHDQQAREMALRCAREITECRYADLRDMTISTNAEVILHELNLASLLEDKAIVDCLEKHAKLDWCYGSVVDIRLLIKTKEPFKERPTLRTAITQAMKEDDK